MYNNDYDDDEEQQQQQQEKKEKSTRREEESKRKSLKERTPRDKKSLLCVFARFGVLRRVIIRFAHFNRNMIYASEK